jgi:Cu-Zn family superoxide dismutase
MNILKCAGTVSVTALLVTALLRPAAAQSANALLRDTHRQDVGTISLLQTPAGVCSSSRSWECLRASMPSTFMPGASASRPRSFGGPALQSGQHAPRHHGGPRSCRRHAELAHSADRLAGSRTGAAITIDIAKPNSVFHPDGTAVVIHGGRDDYMTDPAGNAGNRIACGVISH